MIFGKHINKYYLKYSWALLLGLVFLILVDYLQLEVPELYRMVINGVNTGQVVKDGVTHTFNMDFVLDHICAPFFVIIALIVVGRFAWRICFFGSGHRVEMHLRSRMFTKAKDLSQQFYQVNKVGDLMSLFTNDIATVQECFGWGFMMFGDALFLGGLAIFKMASMHWLLAVLSLIPMALMLAVSIVIGRVMDKRWDARQAAFSSLSDFSQESFSGIAVIKAFVKEFKELWAFKRLNKNNEDANVAYTKASTLLHVLVSLFIESVICIILGYGGYLVYVGTFNAGQLIEFIAYFNTIVWPIMAVSELIAMHSMGKASLKRINKLLDAEPDVVDREDVEDIEEIKGEIEFKNLTFTYPGADYQALTDVSFKINAGESVGIIGRTGTGKTTLVDLILRVYNVEDGTLFIDGHDVNSIPIKRVREFCSYVPQDNFLFSDTIENNIAFSLDEVDSDAVKQSAIYAGVNDDIVEFPLGYDTILGERGVTVSGGQKQRISIARALVKDAPILILDDSVSAVDTNTERTILTNLENTRKGKTTILIAHRVSTIQSMDKIVFVDDGKVIAVGNHDELYNSCEEYRRTVDLQKLEDEKGGDFNA
ncbi:MAG: ABC transporter ATP-binding protein [Clostridia bacterium]|nr:ABC transporter ATP-binding protein [Clostridia bacterium]